MEDTKIIMCFEPDIIQDAVNNCVNKGMNKDILKECCKPTFLSNLMTAFIQKNYFVAPPKIGIIDKITGDFVNPKDKMETREYREVYINTDLDRFVLSIFNEVYQRTYKDLIHENCVSYQKGIGVKKIMKKYVPQIKKIAECTPGKILGYKIDISKYFDSVNKETLFAILDKLDTGSSIDYIIRSYYAEDIIYDENGKPTNRYKSIAQGCAVSAFLANVILSDVDTELSKFNIVYVRYSDDILIIGPDAKKAYDLLLDMLKVKGLKVNPKKVDILERNKWFTFLGVNICGIKITFSQDTIDTFKSTIKGKTKTSKTKKAGYISFKRSVRDIQYYLYTAFAESNKNFGFAEYMFSIVNQEKDIVMLDKYIKDHLRHVYTGKWNFTTNRNKVSKEIFEEAGYVSMVDLYKKYKSDPELYRATVLQMM